MPADLPVEAVAHCRAAVHRRNKSNPEDAQLLRLLMDALDEADIARRLTGDPRRFI